MHSKRNKFIAITTAAAMLTVGVSASTIPASAQTSAPSKMSTTPGAAQGGKEIGQFTSQDWRDIQANAESVGDKESAAAAASMAGGAGGNKNTYNVATNIAKRAVIAALRHGEKKLPSKIAPYAGKIADALATVEKMEKLPIITALVHAGVPVDVADACAEWVVTFMPIS